MSLFRWGREGGNKVKNFPIKNVPFYGRGGGADWKRVNVLNFTLYFFGGRPLADIVTISLLGLASIQQQSESPKYNPNKNSGKYDNIGEKFNTRRNHDSILHEDSDSLSDQKKIEKKGDSQKYWELTWFPWSESRNFCIIRIPYFLVP